MTLFSLYIALLIAIGAISLTLGYILAGNLSNEMKELKNQMNALKTGHRVKSDENVAADERNEMLSHAMQARDVAIESAKKAHQEKALALESMERKLENIKVENAALKDALSKLGGEYAKLKLEFEQWTSQEENQSADYEKTLEEKESLIVTYQERTREVEASGDTLKANLEKANEEISNLKEQIKVLEEKADKPEPELTVAVETYTSEETEEQFRPNGHAVSIEDQATPAVSNDAHGHVKAKPMTSKIQILNELEAISESMHDRMIETFMAQAHDDAEDLQKALDAGKYERMVQIIKDLCMTAENLKINIDLESLQRLENAARNQEIPELMRTHLNAFQHSIGALAHPPS